EMPRMHDETLNAVNAKVSEQLDNFNQKFNQQLPGMIATILSQMANIQSHPTILSQMTNNQQQPMQSLASMALSPQ
ncbi:MAG TPA: hypothetical protein V6C65_23520, partial [Allocoleopsis sp.]